MIFLGLEVLLGTYIVTTIAEKKKKSKKNLIVKRPKNKKQTALISQKVSNKEKKSNHFLKADVLGFSLILISHSSSLGLLAGLFLISYSSVPILKESEKSFLKERRIKNDLLNSVVTVGCLAVGKYYTAAFVTGLYHLSDKMVIKTQDHSKVLLHDIFDQQSNKVWVLMPDGIEIEISAKTVKINDIIIVHAGNMIPVDGCITEGSATIDQHMLTGESMLVEKMTGDQVLSSTLLVSGKILIKAESAGSDTNADKICTILKNTAEHKTATQLYSEKIADKAAIPLICLSSIALPFVGTLSALTILYSSPGNSIKTFTSLQTFNYLIHLSRQDILVKDGRALEALQKVDTVLFDKTGTLTEEQPDVGKILSCSELSEVEILAYAATAESRLAHPIAKAILKYAEDNNLQISPIDEAHYELGYGITVKINNELIKVGSLRFMEMEGINISDSIRETESDWHEKGYSMIAVSKNKSLQGVVQLKPKLRSGIEEMLIGLRNRGIKYLGIVSGDQKEPTKRLAEKLGMDAYYHDVLPQDKASIVEKLQGQGKTVCFIGDGINDTIAIKKSDVSISFSEASAVTSNLAQIVLMDNNISNLPNLFETAASSSLDTQKIVKSLGGTASLQLCSASLLGMTVIGATALQIAVGIAGFSYTMRPLKNNVTNNP